MTQFSRFDAAEFLDSEEVIAEYLAASLEGGDPDLFIQALGDVAKARGIAQVAEASGLGRESLYKALKPGSKLRYETVQKIVDALGVKLTVTRKDAA
ncbi:MAG: putative addiction module antidote protein [Rhizobiaceae bacterium]|nr:putative addiction module antidote protein [Rhizobiaceae bacterium]